MTTFLTEAEVLEICAPLVQKAAMVNYLRQLKLTVNVKPNGMPLVVRAHAEAVLSGRVETAQGLPPAPEASRAQPNRAALLQVVGGRSHGPQKKVQPA